MGNVTRETVQETLLAQYARYYDVLPVAETAFPHIVATCDYHAHSEKYVLTKNAKLWEADSHEYVFLFSVPHLTEEVYRACQAEAYARGMEKVKPGPDHMCSYITAVFLCDSCDDMAQRELQRCRVYKSFRLSFWGWMDFHTVLVQLDTECVSSNAGGRSTAQLLATTLFSKK